MIRNRPDKGWRAAAFAVALFAITLNFFQPLAHAVVMRDGGPEAAARTWGAFCLPSVDQDDGQAPGQSAGKLHECCLGLANVQVLVGPTGSAFLLVETSRPIVFAASDDIRTPVGIRDGPHRPRGPPSSA